MTDPKIGHRVVVSEFGETPPDAFDRYTTLEAMTVPEFASDEVLIAIASASVGWVDLLMTSGQYQHAPKPPYTPGMEYAGIVVAIGPSVDARVTVGQRALVDPFVAGPRSLGKYQRWGGWASYAVVPAHAVLPIPNTLSFDQAANLLGNYETAYHCLVARGRLRAGERVLIHGASGATGLAAVHIAKLLGATVIATGRSDAKLAHVQSEGADHVIRVQNAAEMSAMRDTIKSITGGKGVDVVYDGVGGEVSVASLRCVKFGARFLIVGWAATPFVARGKGERGAPNANQLPTNLIMMKGLDVLGCPTAISTAADPSIRPARLEQILRWAEAGKIRPHVSHVFPLSQIKEAMHAKWSGDVTGGCVVHP